MIPIKAGGIFLLLGGDLPAHTVAGVGGGLDEILSLLLHLLRLLPLLVEAVQQCAEAVGGHVDAVVAVLADRAVGKIEGLSIAVQHCRRKRAAVDLPLPRGKAVPQAAVDNAVVALTIGAADDLTGHQRRHGGKGIQQPAVHRCLLTGQQRRELLLRHRQRITLILSWRQMVEQPRQHLPLL